MSIEISPGRPDSSPKVKMTRTVTDPNTGRQRIISEDKYFRHLLGDDIFSPPEEPKSPPINPDRPDIKVTPATARPDVDTSSTDTDTTVSTPLSDVTPTPVNLDDTSEPEPSQPERDRYERRLRRAVERETPKVEEALRVEIAEKEAEREDLQSQKQRREEASAALNQRDPQLAAKVRRTFGATLRALREEALNTSHIVDEAALRKRAVTETCHILQGDLGVVDLPVRQMNVIQRYRWNRYSKLVEDATLPPVGRRKLHDAEKEIDILKEDLENAEENTYEKLKDTLDGRSVLEPLTRRLTQLRRRYLVLVTEIRMGRGEQVFDPDLLKRRILGTLGLIAAEGAVTKEAIRQKRLALERLQTTLARKKHPGRVRDRLARQVKDAQAEVVDLEKKRRQQVRVRMGRTAATAAGLMLLVGARLWMVKSGMDSSGGGSSVVDASHSSVTPDTVPPPDAIGGSDTVPPPTSIGGHPDHVPPPTSIGGDTVPPPVDIGGGNPEGTQSLIEAFNIKRGAGGYDLLNQISDATGQDIPKSEWHKMAPELVERFPTDFYDMGRGQVGIRHSGMLSQGAIRYISGRLGVS